MRRPPALLELALPLIVQALMIWCNSGTLAPYAGVGRQQVLDPATGYLYNIDHKHLVAPYRMLDGQERSEWDFSVVLRRLLYHALFFPVFTVLGLVGGGLVANVLANAVAAVVFASFLRRRIGSEGGRAALWTLAVYPGIAYWGGLPYSYALIVPGSLLSLLCLWKLAEAGSVQACVGWSLLLGVLFTGYDFLPFFGGAAVLMLAARRRWIWVPIAAGLMVLPMAGVVGIEQFVFGVSPVNNNTSIYGNILRSYTTWPAHANLLAPTLLRLPGTFLRSFLFSNFLFLPLAFAGLAVWSRLVWGARFHPAEAAVLLTVLAVFLLNNLAPPYEGWQMQGDWICRLYQPVFVAYVAFMARAVQQAAGGPASRRRAVAALVAVLVLANASVSFGGILLLPHASHLYAAFYRRYKPTAYLENVRTHGRRPVGLLPKQAQTERE